MCTAVGAYGCPNRPLCLSFLSGTRQVTMGPGNRSWLHRMIRQLNIKCCSGKWRRNTDVVIRCNGEDITRDRPLVTTFDTGCEGSVNLITTYALTEIFKLNLEFSEPRPIGRTLQGGRYMSVGEVEIRWWDRAAPRYMLIRAFVIDSDEFDLYIGRETLEEIWGQGLPLIGGFISRPRSQDRRS